MLVLKFYIDKYSMYFLKGKIDLIFEIPKVSIFNKFEIRYDYLDVYLKFVKVRRKVVLSVILNYWTDLYQIFLIAANW